MVLPDRLVQNTRFEPTHNRGFPMTNLFQRLTQVHMLRKVAVLALTLPLLAATTTLANATERDHERGGGDTYAIGLWGDLPYSDVQAQIGVPNMIADMNKQNLAFTVHDGDFKGGNSIANSVTPTTCSDALYNQSIGYLNALKAPAAFTPGDNDWTDCDRPSNGAFNSEERLKRERALFFGTPYTLGKRRLKQEVQAVYVENRRWNVGRITYVTLNVQGSCNNLCDTTPDPAEYAARNKANITWLRETFAQAKSRKSVAVMIIAQADPGWDLSDVTRAPLRNPRTLAELAMPIAAADLLDVTKLKPVDPKLDGYKDYLVALREEVIAFRKPVSYVHGDSHYQRIDKPFLDDKGRRLENFTRVETPGSNIANGNNDVQWVKVYVDPGSREVFSYQNQVVPANRVAVPAP
jgi:hypothetical protein